MVNSKITGIIVVLSVLVLLPANAQQPGSQPVYEQPPAPCVDETVCAAQCATNYVMVWQTETRQRRKVEYKPVRKTREREERVVVRKPVVETLFREKRIEETSYDEVTEMRDQTYTVRKPVRETQMREQQVTVRQPVTQKLIEVKRTTSYKPVVRTKTMMVPGQAVVSQCQTAVDPTQRSGLQRLSSGYYFDPATGQSVFRRRGLHWVQPTVSVPVAETVPTLVPQQVGQVDYVPEVTEQRKPVEVTRFVDKVETRRVPVEVERLIEETETRKVPVTVKVPRTKVTIERVPYTRTTYKEEVIVKRIPYTETKYEKVETIESYQVEVPRWVPETEVIQVPRTNEPGLLEDVISSADGTEGSPVPKNFSPLDKSPLDKSPLDKSPLDKSPLDKSPQEGNTILNDGEPKKVEGYPGELKLIDPKTLDETSSRSIVEPGTRLTADSAEMKLKSIVPPPTSETSSENQPDQSPGGKSETPGDGTPSETDDESVADQPPVPLTLLTSPK